MAFKFSFDAPKSRKELADSLKEKRKEELIADAYHGKLYKITEKKD